uniref:Uncharacterized protein n=1 Tax=Arundo donax TaxID=35708 RepID=A0A0A9AA60_ARUDO
MWNKCSATWI